MTPPSWLPALLNLDPVWDKNLPTLFAVFKNDFINNQPIVDDIPVWYDRKINYEGYPEGFWHLITRKDQKTNIRHADPPRAKRLPWCGPTLNNSNFQNVYKWNIVERRELKTYIWLYDYDYVIILVNRTMKSGQVLFLETAYHVDGGRSRANLLQKFTNRVV